MNKRSWRDEYSVHPAAEVFPMLPQDELQKLGEDIKANGLREPIVFLLTAQSGEQLLDGRNRLEAMEMVGLSLFDFDRDHYVKTLSTVDPYRYVISKNLRRRHLSKAEQADIIVRVEKEREKNDVAKIARSFSPEPEKRGGSTKDPFTQRVYEQAEESGISERTARAAIAREHAGGVDAVLADLEKKKRKRSPLFKPVAGVSPPPVLDDNPRQCHASCCPEGSDITGPWNVHDAQAFLDDNDFRHGFFRGYHVAVLKILVEVYWLHAIAQLSGGLQRNAVSISERSSRYKGIGQGRN